MHHHADRFEPHGTGRRAERLPQRAGSDIHFYIELQAVDMDAAGSRVGVNTCAEAGAESGKQRFGRGRHGRVVEPTHALFHQQRRQVTYVITMLGASFRDGATPKSPRRLLYCHIGLGAERHDHRPAIQQRLDALLGRKSRDNAFIH